MMHALAVRELAHALHAHPHRRHPACGRRRAAGFSVLALVIGSMIPDLPLFVTIPVSYATTHSIAGLFVACLPLGLACFLAFQLVMKRPYSP